MNLVEISEMLKGVPDTYLTKHVQAPDGTVPQYLALAELQRRQDMRARFAQQAPQTTVADDATQGIAAPEVAMPAQMPAQMPAEMPAQMPAGIAGYREGGRVKSRKELLEEAEKKMEAGSRLDEIYTGDFFQSPFESILKIAGLKPTDKQRSIAAEYNAGQKLMDTAAKERFAADAAKNAGILGAARQRQAEEIAKFPMPNEDQMAMRRQYNEMMATQAGRGPTAATLAAREAADAKAFEQAQFENMMAELAGTPMVDKVRGVRPNLETGRLPPGYEEYEFGDDYGRREAEARITGGSVGGYNRGGAVDRYISRAGTFESGNNPNAKNPFSTASGRFQFIDSTRRRLDKKYGFDPKDRSDETEMARMKAYTQETIDTLEKNNIPVTGGTLYGGHFLGQGGIKKFFEAYSKDPNTNVSEHFSAEIIRKNPAIFNPRGGKPRTTLAEVMEKFDRVGGGRQKTPMTDEDMNLGAAIQVANRADRGDTGGYEDLNMPQAMALATLMEKSKLGKEPYYYPETSPPLQQPDFFYNPIDQQVRAQLLQRYQSPGIMGSMGGFSEGGPVSQERMRRLQAVNAVRAKQNLPPLKSVSEMSFADEARLHESDLAAYQEAKENIIKRPYLSDAPAIRIGEDVLRTVAQVPSYIGALGSGMAGDITSLVSSGFDPQHSAEFKARETPGAKPPSKFFYTPESATNTGGSGILGGAGIKLPPTAPSAQPTPEEVAAAGQRMREEAGAMPSAPAATPPVSQADSFADQFLQELRDAKMSKEEMRQMALLQAGLGMMSGTSPNFGVNVGQGAMAGLQAYQQAKSQNQALASEAYKNMMAARALGLEERGVAVREAGAQSEADYRRRALELQADKLAQDVREFMAKGANTISEEDLTKMANDRVEFARKEQTNPLSQYYGKTDVEIESMIRADIQRAINIAKAAKGNVAVKQMGSAI